MRINTLLALLVIASVVGVLIFIVFGDRTPRYGTSTTVQIAASIYPLAEFAQRVVGGRTTVVSVVPGGTEPHDYEPTPEDLVRVYSSKLFIFNGGEIDPWAGKIET